MPSPLRIVELAARSETGPTREHNEDRYLAGNGVLAVADGMGGARAGEVAAQMAVDSLEAVGRDAAIEELADALRRANGDIHNAASEPDKSGMGTTATAGVVRGSSLFLAHVGDSRAYLWRDGALEALTDDHSVVAEMVRSGQLTKAEAANHPHRNVITRALGAAPSVEIDTPEQGLLPGDVILICSDGLSGAVSDKQIAATIAAGGGLDAIAERLVSIANESSGADNVTVVMGRVDDAPAAPALSAGGGAAGGRRSLPVFEQARARSRRGLRPLVAAVLTLLALGLGAVAWIDSRSFTLRESGGTIEVARGLPIGLERTWQPTGVPASALEEAGDPLTGGARGRGEAVRDAVDLIWTRGITIPEPLSAPTELPPPAARATPTPTVPEQP